MKQFEWMVNYTFQREWIEEKGAFTPLAFYSGSLGAGLYIVSLYFDMVIGMIIGWLIVAVIKSFFHIADLYHPFRAFRMLARPQSSWISRGLIITLTFLIAALFTIIFSYSNAENLFSTIFKIISFLAAISLCVYPSFVLRSAKGIKVWHSVWIPIIFFACGILGGTGILNLMELIITNDTPNISYVLFYIITILLFISVAAFMYSIYRDGDAGRVVVKKIIMGSLKYVFWLGIVLAGVLIPFTMIAIDKLVKLSPAFFLLVNSFGALILGICTIFTILKIGIYEPLVK